MGTVWLIAMVNHWLIGTLVEIATSLHELDVKPRPPTCDIPLLGSGRRHADAAQGLSHRTDESRARAGTGRHRRHVVGCHVGRYIQPAAARDHYRVEGAARPDRAADRSGRRLGRRP